MKVVLNNIAMLDIYAIYIFHNTYGRALIMKPV